MQININDQTIQFHVEYGKRKNITLDMSPEGLITVKAPTKTPESSILEFVRANSKSILTFLEKLEHRQYIARSKNYQENENFLYLGKACPLKELLDEIPTTDDEIQVQLKRFYTTKTRELIKKRVKQYEKVIGVKAKSITIVESARAWGTCNSNKELTFNYRLSMAPISVIDYVIIHELCHILHMNHDRSFWRKVGSYDTNYKASEDYLARVGGFMTI